MMVVEERRMLQVYHKRQTCAHHITSQFRYIVRINVKNVPNPARVMIHWKYGRVINFDTIHPYFMGAVNEASIFEGRG
jgi:hypothetical protein